MIPQIKEINFPTDTTLSTATATLVEMGDKTISAQVKVDGSIVPDFSDDWEIEFQGERYIQPLREPQASKGNESINSIIDLTFYHKGIYDLKRYFFVSIVELEAGTIMADNYIVPLRLNISEFVDYLNKVLSYYYGSTYTVDLNPDYPFDETDKKDIDINNTKIWDVVTQIYEWFGVRWSWETSQNKETEEYEYCIKVGYDPVETSHIFEYGFKGGLLKFEHQVQNAEIANVVFGRGSSENIPYRYFKDADPNNPTFPADPDWIPELANVHFANLRGKTFRDYVQGWKTNPNRDTLNDTLPIETLDLAKWLENEAYKKGHEDTTFNPIEYVKDDNSIAKYGEIQKGLEHNEEIKPTIQGVDILGIGRVDEVVAVEQVLDDNSNDNVEGDTDDDITNDTITQNISFSTYEVADKYLKEGNTVVITRTRHLYVPKGYKGSIAPNYRITAYEECPSRFCKGQGLDGVVCDREYIASKSLECTIKYFRIIDASTGYEIRDFDKIPPQKELYIEYKVEVTGFQESYDNIKETAWGSEGQSLEILERTIYVEFEGSLECSYFNGDIISNYTETGRIFTQLAVGFGKTKETTLRTNDFTITQDKSFILDVDVNITANPNTSVYSYEISKIKAINVDTNEEADIANLSKGTYYLDIVVAITNEEVADGSEPNPFLAYTIELLPTYIYYSSDIDEPKRTFDIWVKNIWQTMPEKGESDSKYEHRIWDAILGNHLGDDAKVVFSSGMLSGHSDWEFLIADTPKRDTSKTIDYVPSEWRITLYKSDAEIDATGKYIPSTMTQASAGDHFYFTGIELPQQYVEWAEERLDEYKREELAKYSEIKPTIIIHTDPIRINELQGEETSKLIDSLQVGNLIKVRDFRFIKSDFETLRLQSITYTWNDSTILYPNVEIVLSNDVVILRPKIEEVTSNITRISRDVSNLRSSSTKELKATKSSFNSRIDKSNNAIVLLERRVLNLEKISGGVNLSELEKKVQTNSESIDAILTIKTINKRNEITILTKLKK